MTVEAIKRRLRRRARLALAAMLACLPFVVMGARASVDGMRITPEKWAPPSHPERRVFDEFRRRFEGNDVVLISWEGCTIDDRRLLEFEKAVRGQNRLPSLGTQPPFDRVETGYSAVRQLTAAPLNLSREQACRRLQGVLVGPDSRTSCALVVLTYDGNERRKESIAHLVSLAESASGLPAGELHVAGPPHDGVAIDTESIRGVNVFGTGSTVIAGLLCLWFLRSWRIAGVIIATACFGQGLFLSTVYYLGWTLDAILIVAPPLIFLLTVSAGIHLTNYFLSQDKQLTDAEAVDRALAEGLKPCWLAAATTAIGLCSLMVSEIAPVVAFGGFTAASLVATMQWLMCLLPDALVKWPLTQRGEARVGFENRWSRIGAGICRRSTVIVAAGALLLIAASTGIPRLRTSVDAAALFAADSPIIRDYNWFESNIGAVVPIEVVVDFDASNALGFHERVDLVNSVDEAIRELAAVSGVVSPLTFMPDRSGEESGQSALRSALILRRIAADRQDIIDRHYLYADETCEAWRVGGRVSAMQGVNYAELLEELRQCVGPLVSKSGHAATIDVRYTGMMPLIQSVQVTILHDLMWSLLTAFAFIGLAIYMALRDFRLTWFATVLNMFPVIVVFGAMGLLEIPIDIGTMMTAGVALGIAVDDTVHFLCSYARASVPDQSAELTAQATIRVCGAAMLRTTVICTAGMLVFALSSFVPTRQFAVMMAATLVSALAGDLLLLPAILVSPLGRRIRLGTSSPGHRMEI